jgi:hypothetical protein
MTCVHLVCAQVDDLEEIGDLEGYIDRTRKILVYCSKGYFQSANCMRELVAATTMSKSTIALLDPDGSRGGLPPKEIQKQLIEAEQKFEKWGIDDDAPLGEDLYRHLFAREPIEVCTQRRKPASTRLMLTNLVVAPALNSGTALGIFKSASTARIRCRPVPASAMPICHAVA